jgi:hypothetical protein
MIILKLNFSKAYDKVNWDFMLNCIERINIPSVFVIKIRILSSSAKAMLIESFFKTLILVMGVW